MFKKSILVKDILVKCNTEEQLTQLFKYLDSNGFKWASGGSLLDTTPGKYIANYFSINRKIVTYDSIEWYAEEGDTVTPFNELLETNLEDLIGQTVLVRDSKYANWRERTLLAVLPAHIHDRYIVQNTIHDNWATHYKFCKALLTVKKMTLEEVITELGYDIEINAQVIDCTSCGNYINDKFEGPNCNGCAKNPFYMNCFTAK